MALTTDIDIQNTDFETKRRWNQLKDELGVKSNREAMEWLMDKYDKGLLVVLPSFGWEPFQAAVAEAACRQASQIAKKEVRRVLYEEGFIPSPK